MFVSNPSKISSQVSVLNWDWNPSTAKQLIFLTQQAVDASIGAM